jgi:organic hydroperoxide reductase OsmC/OhrA
MSEHRIQTTWKKETSDFKYETYNRSHSLKFEGGQSLKGSSAPDFVGDAALANPEELFAAALSSCHMLTFLAIACKASFVVASYTDNAVATLEKNAEGKMAVTKVALNPKIEFQGSAPDAAKLAELHEKAHKYCMIANSVSAKVSINS